MPRMSTQHTTAPTLAAALLLLTFLLGACSSTPETDERAAAELYRSAQSAMSRGDFVTAVQDLERLESRYPFGPYAEQGQVDVIYAYYRVGEPDSAIAAAERFLRFNPRHPRVDYAWYMRGVVDQERGENFLGRWFDLDRTARDPEPLRRAFETFRTLLDRHPETEYADDSRERMREIRDMLARHEVSVAHFYLEREAWVAAANRARDVLRRYPGSPESAEALRVLEVSYRELDLPELREDIRRILELNDIGTRSG